MASRQAECGLKPFQVLWLRPSIDELRNCLTTVHSIDGMHPTARSASLGSAEGKYFTTSAAEASAYAKQAVNAFGDQPYTIIRTDVPNSIFRGLSPAAVDRGIPAWVIPTDRLPGLVPHVMDHSPLPPARF
ncbi:MAG: hypothetical protein CFE27_00085 [Alphaproteobacteria bacterium PA1]|nr:MAG: hypothetical protein CFE27_00085 [Alphaproteobacteria bacterium PA1]